MTYLVERLAELRSHLDHLRSIRSRVTDAASLQRDRSLHNDVLFSLLMIAQLVIDIAGELGVQKGAGIVTAELQQGRIFEGGKKH